MMENIIKFAKNNVFAVITASAAIVALFQTQRQIRLNNKQFLFEKRLNKYLLAKSLIELYNEHKQLLEYNSDRFDEPIIVDLQFTMLTNINFLKDITCVINDPKNNEYKNNFLIKIEEIKKLSNEIKFLFPYKNKFLFQNLSKNYLSDFVWKYQNLLMELYKYQILINNMENANMFKKNMLTYTELQEKYGEKEYRMHLYKSISDLNESYEKLIKNKIIKKIEKLIKL